MGSDTSERGERAILTVREREILQGEADVTDNYRYRVVSRIRNKIKRLDRDVEILDENHSELASELRKIVCNGDISE